MARITKGWLAVAVLLTACDGGTEPHVPEVRVEDVVLEARGDTVSLALRSGAIPGAVAWESLDPAIVTVTGSGLATAVAPGSAGVVASLEGVEDTATVTVLPAVDVRVSRLVQVTGPNGEHGLEMRIRNEGGRGYYRLELWTHDPDGMKRRVQRDAEDVEAAPGLDITDRRYYGDDVVEWVLAYSREPLAGEAVRTSCARLDGRAEEAEPCPSDLPDAGTPADSVVIAPLAGVMRVGDIVQYRARAFFRGVELSGRVVLWSTPSPDVVSISETGRAVALRPGYGQVDATVDGITTSAALTVVRRDPGSPVDAVAAVRLNPPRFRVWQGQGRGVAAAVYDSLWHEIEGVTLSWATEHPEVAVVQGNGFVVGTGHGRTRVVATAGGVSGYAVVDSYARPDGAAELEYHALLSAAVDPGTLEPSIDTVWVDGAGVAHDAWMRVRPGSLSMRWGAAGGSYSQRLVLSTYIYEDGEIRTVDRTEYTDEGTLERWWDYLEGRDVFDFTSTTTAGLRYRATWSIPGELEVEQTVGSIGKRPYYFRLLP